MNALLAPQDAKLGVYFLRSPQASSENVTYQVIVRNWGERHRLAGAAAFGLPMAYTWIYAPRNEEELDAVETFLVAAIGHMTDSPSVQR